MSFTKSFRFLLAGSLSFLIFGATPVQAQTPAKDKKEAARTALRAAVENRRYHFLAQTAIPTGGRSRLLTTPYTLALRGDTLDADLPYFGRAYSASIGSSDGGIRFVTTDFTYLNTPGKKQGWEIVFTPKDQSSASRIRLTLSIDGNATLSVQSNNRQSIQFFGNVTANSRQ